MAQSFNPPEVWQPFGAFAMGTVQGAGKVVHLKGQVALDRDGRILGKGDMAAQTLKVLENIQSVLASVGGTMADIFQLAHYTTDIEAFMAGEAFFLVMQSNTEISPEKEPPTSSRRST